MTVRRTGVLVRRTRLLRGHALGVGEFQVVEEVQAVCHRRRLRAARDAQLGQDVGDVHARRLGRDVELLGDLAVAAALGDPAQDVLFAGVRPSEPSASASEAGAGASLGVVARLIRARLARSSVCSTRSPAPSRFAAVWARTSSAVACSRSADDARRSAAQRWRVSASSYGRPSASKAATARAHSFGATMPSARASSASSSRSYACQIGTIAGSLFAWSRTVARIASRPASASGSPRASASIPAAEQSSGSAYRCMPGGKPCATTCSNSARASASRPAAPR